MRHLVHFLLTFSTYTVLINGQGILPAESSLSLDPLVTLVGCLREEKPGYCLQRRALNFFESWITTEGDDEDIADGLNPSDEASERLPAGLSPYWSKFVDSVAERLSKMYGDEEDEPDEVEDVLLKDNNKVNKNTKIKSRQGDSQIEDGRGHHKKKKKLKAIKKAIIKLVLIALLIKHKLKMLLTAFQTFLQFKAVLLATILVIIHAIKLWVEIKHKHHPQKVIYYENAHHQHHYDEHHHDDHYDDHQGWSLWGRSGVEPPTTTPINYYNAIASYLSKRSSEPDNLAYSAYVPQQQAKQPTTKNP